MMIAAPADIIGFPGLGAVKARTGWMARCPAHDDRSPSLSLKLAQDGRLLLYCFAGCTVHDIVTRLGLSLRDLFPPTPNSSPRRAPISGARPRTALGEARVQILREGRRQQHRLAP